MKKLVMVYYVGEVTLKSCKHGEYGSFEHLLFLCSSCFDPLASISCINDRFLFLYFETWNLLHGNLFLDRKKRTDKYQLLWYLEHCILCKKLCHLSSRV